jgi:hypothetical protein
VELRRRGMADKSPNDANAFCCSARVTFFSHATLFCIYVLIILFLLGLVSDRWLVE